jgi:hypothetical protein
MKTRSLLPTTYLNATSQRTTLTGHERTPLRRLSTGWPWEDVACLVCMCTTLCSYRTWPVPLVIWVEDPKWVLTQTYAARHIQGHTDRARSKTRQVRAGADRIMSRAHHTYSSILRMEEGLSSETSANIYQTDTSYAQPLGTSNL